MLESKLATHSRNASKPPSSDGPQVAPRKRKPGSRGRGGQPGHEGTSRRLVPAEQVDQSVDCRPTSCEACGALREGDDPVPERHQVATLVAFAREYEVLAQDDAFDLFDLFLAKLLGEAREEGQRERLKTFGDLDEAAMTLARACQMRLGEGGETTDVREAIFAQVPRDEPLGALQTVGAISRPPDDLYHDSLAERYTTVRRFLPTYLKTLCFQSVDTARGVIRALDFLA